MTGADLPAVVAGIWSRAGYDTTVEERDGETYVIASRDGSVPADLVLLARGGVDARRVEAFAATVADLTVDTAYVVSDGPVPADARRRARAAEIVTVGGRNLATLAAESGVALPTTGEPARVADRTHGDGPGDRSDGRGRTATATADRGKSSADANDDGDPPDDHTEEKTEPELSHIESIRRKIGETTDEDDEGANDGTGDDGTAGGDLGDAEDPTGHTGLEGAGDTDDGTSGSDVGAFEDSNGDDDDSGYIVFGDDAGDGVPTDDPESEPPRGSERRPGRRRSDDEGRFGSVLPDQVTRRKVVATVAGATAVGLADHFVFNLVLGDESTAFPAYNETSVKANAASVPPKSVLQNADALAQSDQPVTYEGVVADRTSEGGLVHFSLVTGTEGQTVRCRYDGDLPRTGARVTVWGVVTGTAALDGSEVVTVDVVDLRTEGNGEGTTGGESESTRTAGANDRTPTDG